MQQKKLKFSTVFLFIIGLTGLQAQSTIPASGGNATGIGGSASYSIGQVVYIKFTGTNGSSTQGVQQPFEISVITGIEEARDISLEIVVFPNPATDFIKLVVKNFEAKNLKYQLYDISGSLLLDNEIDSNEITISMQNLRPSVYILKVTQGRKEIKTFKIIKY